VNFYEGPPFKLKKMNNKNHTNYVTSVKYSPDGEHFISVGYDKKVVLYDGKESSSEIIADDKTEGNHKSSICAVYWLNNKGVSALRVELSRRPNAQLNRMTRTMHNMQIAVVKGGLAIERFMTAKTCTDS